MNLLKTSQNEIKFYGCCCFYLWPCFGVRLHILYAAWNQPAARQTVKTLPNGLMIESWTPYPPFAREEAARLAAWLKAARRTIP